MNQYLAGEGVDLEGMSTETCEGMVREGELQLQAEVHTSQETSPHSNLFDDPTPPSLNLYNLGGYDTVNALQELCNDKWIIHQASFNDSKSEYASHSYVLNDQNPTLWNSLSFPGNHYDSEVSGFNFDAELPHPIELSENYLNLDHDYSSIVNEAIALARLDYDIARTPLFTAQLEEYLELRCSGLLETFDVKLEGCSRESRDRLQLWPEKVVVAEQMLGRLEVDDEISLVIREEYSDGGEGVLAGDFIV